MQSQNAALRDSARTAIQLMHSIDIFALCADNTFAKTLCVQPRICCKLTVVQHWSNCDPFDHCNRTKTIHRVIASANAEPFSIQSPHAVKRTIMYTWFRVCVGFIMKPRTIFFVACLVASYNCAKTYICKLLYSLPLPAQLVDQ